MKSAKIELKLVRSFSLGIVIASPKWNGLCITVMFACVHVQLWSRGQSLVSVKNYWNV